MSPIYQAEELTAEKKWDETKNIISFPPPPAMENNVDSIPIGYIHALIYYIIILSVSYIFAHCTFKKMLGCWLQFF